MNKRVTNMTTGSEHEPAPLECARCHAKVRSLIKPGICRRCWNHVHRAEESHDGWGTVETRRD